VGLGERTSFWKGENIDKNIVFLNLARVWFTRGGLLIGMCHPGTMVAASVPPNGFIFEGALGKAPSISPERWRAFCCLIRPCRPQLIA
jgi:hypothetical protein